jgi:hypothetical protein
MTANLTSKLAGRVASIQLPPEIREGDRTSKFRITDKQGNIESVCLGADLFNLFSVPVALTRQLHEEYSKIVVTVQNWAQDWKNHIEGWELYPRDGAMQNYFYFHFVVTHKGVEYDKQLAEALMQLDGHLYDIGCSMIRVTVLMVPNVSDEEMTAVWA